MSSLSIFNRVQTLTKFIFPKYLPSMALIHTLTRKSNLLLGTESQNVGMQGLLEFRNPQLYQTRGLKYKMTLNLRCKDCYYETIDDVLHVQCKTHGRHKQRKRTKKPKNTWIITGISTGLRREW